MIIYEGVLVFGSCLADYALPWMVILTLWFLFFIFIYWTRRRRGTATEIAIWRWVGGGLSVVFVAIAVGFAFSERKTVRVVTIGKDIDIVGCVGVNRETARLPLSDVRFEYWSHGPSSHPVQRQRGARVSGLDARQVTAASALPGRFERHQPWRIAQARARCGRHL
jgi:hypothetical protein